MRSIKKHKYYILAAILIIVLILLFILSSRKATAPPTLNAEPPKTEPLKMDKTETLEISFVGPRGNVPEDTPTDYGFWSFAIPAPGLLSRSGQPTLAEFAWLKKNGWKSDINLRVDGDHSPEVSDDALIPGFNELGLNYLKIQMLDGAAPTDAQAEEFLNFITNPANQPAHVHCRGGIGRAGIMVAIFRYTVQGWPLSQAIEESRLFQGGISESQEKWFKKWGANHAAGSWNK